MLAGASKHRSQSYISKAAETCSTHKDCSDLIPLEFLDDLMRLKLVPRSGWISYRIGKHDVEPVSSHSYAVSVIALTMSETMRLRNQKINVEQVLRMALLHDLSESLTFDISKAYLRYLGRSGSRLKTSLERKAISRILTGLQSQQLAKIFRESLEEYSAAKSLEARIVHCADALDLLLQILEYQKMGYAKTTLDPIWRETRSKLLSRRLALGNEWLRGLERVRGRLDRKNRGGKHRLAANQS
jgi:5'-deoxynucleotidase YfbR-like HD superfamily hydrolase